MCKNDETRALIQASRETLAQNGYSSIKSAPPKWELGSSWAYQLVCDSEAPRRLIARSPILYVGAGDFKRIKTLFHHGAHQAMARLAEVNLLRGTDDHLSVDVWVRRFSNPASGEAELLEKLALNDYYRCHGELPPLNRKHEGWVAGKVMARLARQITTKRPRVRDYPHARASVVRIDGCPLGREQMVLIWVWPDTWRNALRAPLIQGKSKAGYLVLAKGSVPALLTARKQNANETIAQFNVWVSKSAVADAPADALAGASLNARADDVLKLWTALGLHLGPPATTDDLAQRLVSIY